MKHIPNLLLFPLLLVLLSGCNLSWQQYGRSQDAILAGVQVDLQPLDEKVEAGQPIYLRFSLTNTGSSPVRICRWHSPLEGRFSTDYFQVFRKKRMIHYTGNRPKPQSMLKDYVTLYPGETLSKIVDVQVAYAFHRSGKYDIRFRGSQINRLPDSEIITVKVK